MGPVEFVQAHPLLAITPHSRAVHRQGQPADPTAPEVVPPQTGAYAFGDQGAFQFGDGTHDHHEGPAQRPPVSICSRKLTNSTPQAIQLIQRLQEVADLLGHSQIQMTMRYAHLAPEHTLAAVERLAELGARQGGLISSNSFISYQSLSQAEAGSGDAKRNKTAEPTGTKTSTDAFQSRQPDSSYVH